MINEDHLQYGMRMQEEATRQYYEKRTYEYIDQQFSKLYEMIIDLQKQIDLLKEKD